MSTIRGVKDRRFKFVQLLNEMFENPTLSLKAKGFIGFCLTKKENWDFHVSHLCSVLKEKDTAIYSVINECIEHGYAYRYQDRGPDGRMLPGEFVISDSKTEITTLKKEYEERPGFKKSLPDHENTGAASPDLKLPHPENTGAVISLENPRENEAPIYSNTDKNNTDIYKKQQQEQGEEANISVPVCSLYKTYSVPSDSFSLDEKAKAFGFLMQLGIEIKAATDIIEKHCREDLLKAKEYLELQMHVKAKKNETLSNIAGYFKRILENRWWEPKKI